MSASNEPDKLERERLDADRRYNDALTTLDRLVEQCRGRALESHDFERLFHALVLFLQQITAAIDTKDRAIAGDLRARLDRFERALADIDELRTRVNVIQRQTRNNSQISSLNSQVSSLNSQGSTNAAPTSPPDADVVYVAFEDQFRGSDEAVGAKLEAYLPIFAGTSDVVDLGCGRGEFLAALAAAGVRGRGVDANAEMAATARARGLDVEHGDALAFVRGLPNESVDGAIATQVIEHLEPPYLMQLVDALARKLRPGAPLVLETINPACWLAFFSSYIRDFTHVKPIHPDTLQYLLRAGGFERVEVRYSSPVPDAVKLRHVDLPAAVLASADPTVGALVQVAHTVNANAAILNGLMFTFQDYAVVAYRA